MPHAQQRQIFTRQGIVGANGVCQIVFDPSPAGYVLEGTVSVTIGPPDAQWTLKNGTTQGGAVGATAIGQQIITTIGGTPIYDVQIFDNETTYLEAVNLQPGEVYQAQLFGILQHSSQVQLKGPKSGASTVRVSSIPSTALTFTEVGGPQLVQTNAITPGMNALVLSAANPGNYAIAVTVSGSQTGNVYCEQGWIGLVQPLSVPINPALDTNYIIEITPWNTSGSGGIVGWATPQYQPDPPTNMNYSYIDLVGYSGTTVEYIIPWTGAFVTLYKLFWMAYDTAGSAEPLGRIKGDSNFPLTSAVNISAVACAGGTTSAVVATGNIDFGPNGLPLYSLPAQAGGPLWFAGNSSVTSFSYVGIGATYTLT